MRHMLLGMQGALCHALTLCERQGPLGGGGACQRLLQLLARGRQLRATRHVKVGFALQHVCPARATAAAHRDRHRQ